MIFLYLCLTLLPAAALGVCNDDSALPFFFFLDTNDDQVVDRKEVFGAFDLVDADGDRRITLDEFTQALGIYAPELEGFEEGILNLLDIDNDGVISLCDAETDFTLIDVNKDGVKTVDEFKKYLDVYCQRNEAGYNKK